MPPLRPRARRLIQPAIYAAAGGGGGGDAAETTAFLARTSGLSGTETTAYKALINGLVADGNFALLDALYILATKDTTTANLNLISTSFGLTQSGSVTFTADVGYTGAGGWLDTGFDPAAAPSPKYTLNSASIGFYIPNARTTNDSAVIMGAQTAGYASYCQPCITAGSNFIAGAVNESTGSLLFANTSTQGAWIQARVSSSDERTYLNGSSTAYGTASTSSAAISGTTTFTLLALNLNASPLLASPDSLRSAFIGGGLTGAQAAAINNRINDYMTALGVNIY